MSYTEYFETVLVPGEDAMPPYLLKPCPFWAVIGGSTSSLLWYDKINGFYVLSDTVGQQLDRATLTGYIFNEMPVWRSVWGEVWWDSTKSRWTISPQAGWFAEDPDALNPDYRPIYYYCNKSKDTLPDGTYISAAEPGNTIVMTLKRGVNDWRRELGSYIGEYTNPGKPNKYVGFRKFKDDYTGHEWCDVTSSGILNNNHLDYKYQIGPVDIHGDLLVDRLMLRGDAPPPGEVERVAGWIIRDPLFFPDCYWFKRDVVPATPADPSGDYVMILAPGATPKPPENYTIKLTSYMEGLPAGDKVKVAMHLFTGAVPWEA